MSFVKSATFGFDISFYQDSDLIPGDVDFQKMKAYGASFVNIRVGQGNYIDSKFAKNWQAARGVLPRGAYWFYDPRWPPVAQANLCVKALQYDRPEGRVWLDLEYNWTSAYGLMSDWLYWLEYVEAAGFRVGVYTGDWWWYPNVTKKGLSTTNFARFETWIADYAAQLTELPRGLKVPMIWQDGTPAVGLAAGVESKEIDHNIWNANYDFASEWGIVPTPEPGGTDMTTMLVNKAIMGLNLRSAPDATQANLIGNVHAEDVLICDTKVTGKANDGTPLFFTRIKAVFRLGVLLDIPSGEVWAASGNTNGYQLPLAWVDVPTSGGLDLQSLTVALNATPIQLMIGNGSVSRVFSGSIVTELK